MLGYIYVTDRRISENTASLHFLENFIMPRSPKSSPRLRELFWDIDDHEASRKLIKKLLQYNMQYEEITKVILSHTERAFLDARLITLEEYYRELQSTKTSEITSFLDNLPAIETLSVRTLWQK